ncbi:unnamed protein product [Ostreobium quekettii]|uniref:Uncharacterized protein n=1 Tax=Ostreobium quekettii TaxID=121088 RepID=A0A8S1J1D4_9CHLO|nr:unnamed protein product [Ostreobium quekettii]|eukprot:evm.model.scf_226EXC.17 EVM.evm.TU.scf_226EXC.17   scf_226EXC:109273-111451(+)
MEMALSCRGGTLKCRWIQKERRVAAKRAVSEATRSWREGIECGGSVQMPSAEPERANPFVAGVVGTVVAGALLLSPQAAVADMIETVAPSTMAEYAKPLPQETVDKGRVWLFLVLGATGLFLGTVALENVEGFFPAIAKANKAMARSRAGEYEQEEAYAEESEIAVARPSQEVTDDPYYRAVEDGLAAARAELLDEYKSAGMMPMTEASGPPSPSVPLPDLVAGNEDQSNADVMGSGPQGMSAESATQDLGGTPVVSGSNGQEDDAVDGAPRGAIGQTVE